MRASLLPNDRKSVPCNDVKRSILVRRSITAVRSHILELELHEKRTPISNAGDNLNICKFKYLASGRFVRVLLPGYIARGKKKNGRFTGHEALDRKSRRRSGETNVD